MTYIIEIHEEGICIAHQLRLPYESRCNDLHGHSYAVVAVIQAPSLNPQGMVMDFTHVKAVIKKYDHAFLGQGFRYSDSAAVPTVVPHKFFPQVEPSTAENFARVLYEEIGTVLLTINPAAELVSVSVWETPNNKVTITK
jgi:6-pyruvoyltetrahydropterin/6-carboxytetrahydropterin synthase